MGWAWTYYLSACATAGGDHRRTRKQLASSRLFQKSADVDWLRSSRDVAVVWRAPFLLSCCTCSAHSIFTWPLFNRQTFYRYSSFATWHTSFGNRHYIPAYIASFAEPLGFLPAIQASMPRFFYIQRANAKFTRRIRFYAELRLASRDGSFYSSYQHNNKIHATALMPAKLFIYPLLSNFIYYL